MLHSHIPEESLPIPIKDNTAAREEASTHYYAGNTKRLSHSTSHNSVSHLFRSSSRVSLDDITFGTLEDMYSSRQSLALDYFSLYASLLVNEQEERYQVAYYIADTLPSESKQVDVNSLASNQFPGFKELFYKHLDTASFQCIRVPLQFASISNLKDQINFKSACIFESDRSRWIECTTTVYSNGSKMLETREVKHPEETTTYKFDFVEQFLNVYLKGCLEFQYMDAALNTVTIIQAFRDIHSTMEPTLILALAYTFHVGEGPLQVVDVKDLGISD